MSSSLYLACGLPPRRRDKAAAPGFVQEPGLSQEREAGLRQQLLNVMGRIVEELLAKGNPILTFGKFKSMSLPQCSDIPNLDRDSMLKQLEAHKFAREVSKIKGKGKRCLVPNVLGHGSLQDVVDLQSLECKLVFPEAWHVSSLRTYCSGALSREHNIVTLVSYYDACLAAGKRKGAGKHIAATACWLDRNKDTSSHSISQDTLARMPAYLVTTEVCSLNCLCEPNSEVLEHV